MIVGFNGRDKKAKEASEDSITGAILLFIVMKVNKLSFSLS